MTAAPSDPKESQSRMSSVEKQLVIHIGDPKTGTSSIQKALQMDLVRSEVGSISGYLNARMSANAVAIARSFHGRDPQRVRAAMAELGQWISTAPQDFLILSSEFFAEATPGVLKRAFLRRHPELAASMKVIGYVRPHAGRCLSAYSERVKCGYTFTSFTDWLPKFIASDAMRYAPRFLQWRKTFGDGFALRPFLRSELRNGDAVSDFFSIALGDLAPRIGSMEHENQSVSLRALAGLLAFNRNLNRLSLNASQRIPLALAVAREIAPHPDDRKPELDRISTGRIFEACQNDARKLDRAFFGRPLFEPELVRATEGGADQPMNLSLDAYFTAAEQAGLERHVMALPGLVAKNWAAWHDFYAENRARRNLGQPTLAEGGGEIQDRLEDIGRILSLTDAPPV